MGSHYMRDCCKSMQDLTCIAANHVQLWGIETGGSLEGVDGMKIDSDVPMPPDTRNVLFDTVVKMNVGDSFHHKKKARPNMGLNAQKTGFSFVIRADGDGWRVWRVA